MGTLSIAGAPGSASTAAAAWKPGPAQYGVGQTSALVTMRDGTRLHAAIFFPTDRETGGAASGPFPVLLSTTPYGKLGDEGAGRFGLAALSGKSDYLIERGYIQVSADVRGTGASEGTFGLFDPVQGEDGAALARWAARLPNSSGRVGLVGASYLGISQFATAAAAGPDSPIKAMFPIVAGTALYRDEVTAGGIPSLEFNLPYLGALVPALYVANPVVTGGDTTVTALTDRLQGLLTAQVPQITRVVLGQADAYDGPYWDARSPFVHLRKIVEYGIPAFMVGGWYDLFQRGEPLNFSGLQNAYRGRPILAPMTPRQRPTARYQLLQGPYYHLTAGQGLDHRGLDLSGLTLAWFDRWLKGVDTQITRTRTPLHLWDLGSRTWREAQRWPVEHAKPTTYYLRADKRLSAQPPESIKGADTLVWTGATIPCSTSIEQWGAGIGVLLFGALRAQQPCTADARPSQVGPGQVSYTTPPFERPTTLAGPIGATLYAHANTTETEWVVNVSDVGPDGKSRMLTQGLLAGSHRALDRTNTWQGSDDRPILPYHPYTRAALQRVVPGQITRYDVEVFPVANTFEPGHRLRITVASSDFPHAFPHLDQFPRLIGGVYELQRTAAHPSSVELPLSAPEAFAAAPTCTSRRSVTIHVGGRRARVRRATATVGGRRVKARRVGRNGVRISLRSVPEGRVAVVVRATLRGGRHVRTVRRYRTCVRGRASR